MRLGGDEFAILIEDELSLDVSVEIAERVQRALDAPFPLCGREVFVRASIGIAELRAGNTADDLLRNADVAMYRAKDGGKGCFAIYESGMHTAAVQRLELRSEIERAVSEGELAVVYQPIVDLGRELIVGAEALVRWQHPTLGLIAPDQFIPLAEETGLIVPLGRWVLEQTCHEARLLADRTGGNLPVMLGVNVSGRQLQEAGFTAMVATVLATSGLEPDRLMLEITESALMENSTLMADRLAVAQLPVSLPRGRHQDRQELRRRDRGRRGRPAARDRRRPRAGVPLRQADAGGGAAPADRCRARLDRAARGLLTGALQRSELSWPAC